MITLRQHLTSLVAVFLALAIGLALGGGLLGGSDGSTASGDSDGASTSTPSSGANDAARQATYSERLITGGAARLYAGGLTGHAVAVVTMPGTESSQVKALDAQVVLAGGAVTGTYAVSATLLDPEHRTAMDSLGGQLVGQLADPRLDPGASTYVRLGQLVGLAMATTETTSQRADTAAVTIRQSLANAKLLTSPTDVRLAPLVLVVLPSGSGGSSSAQTILADLVTGMSTTAAGVVAAGDSDSASDGDLGALRQSELSGPVATVDGIENVPGQVTAVLALMSVLGGTGGSYGASGKDGPVPLP